MKWTITYFSESVRQDIATLPSGILASYLRLIEAMEIHGVHLRMPHSRMMGGGLFELRPKGPEGIGRVFYCTQVGQHIVVLHAFVKKTQQTPENELRIARKRLKEIRNA